MNDRSRRQQVAPVNSREQADKILAEIQDIVDTALPSTVSRDAFRDVFLTTAQREPKIFMAEKNSVRQALIHAARAGLMPDGKMSALVPFNNSKSDKQNKLEVQFIIMVMGYIHLFKKHAGVHSMTVNIVYEKDKFTYIEGFETVFEHRPDVFSEDRGEKIGVYAIFRDKDEKVMHLEIMSKADVMKAKAVSKMKGGPWTDFEEEMWRKTVVRRSAKYLPLTEEVRNMIETEDRETIDFDLPTVNRSERSSEYNPIRDAARIAGNQQHDEDGVVDEEDPPFEQEGPSEDDLDAAWDGGLEAKENGKERQAPEGYSGALLDTWLRGWDKGVVKEKQTTKAEGSKKSEQAKDKRSIDGIINNAKAQALANAERVAPGDLTEAEKTIWLKAYDDQVEEANANG